MKEKSKLNPVLQVDPEFESKIPPLSEEEYQKLEENIVAEGVVLMPLIVWKNTIVDGHNRYKIAQAHPSIIYLSQKSSITEREQEIAAETRSLEQSMADSTPEQNEAIIKYVGYAEVNELTADMVNDLVRRVNVYPDDTLEVQLNFADELEELQAQLAEAS
jgi:hypothetical protein